MNFSDEMQDKKLTPKVTLKYFISVHCKKGKCIYIEKQLLVKKITQLIFLLEKNSVLPINNI